MANSGNTTQQKNWKKVMCVILSVIMALGTFLSMTVGSLFLSDHFGVKTAYAAENDVNAPHFYRYNELVGLYKTNYQNEEKLQYKIGEDGEWTEYKLPFTIPAFETTRVYARLGENGTIVYDDLTVTGEALGVYTESSTDFEFSYENIVFDYTRVYNSLENRWFNSIDSNIVIFDGYIEATLPDGSKYIFVQTANDKYVDELNGFTLTYESGYYILNTDYYKYFFDAYSEYLVAIEDNNGNRLELITNEINENIREITDNNGRSFTINDYYLEGQYFIREIIDPNGKPIWYSLSPNSDVSQLTDRYLVAIDQADVIIGQYEYEDESPDAHLIRSMDKSIEYYDNGRLKSITYDDGSYINYTYDDENMLFTALTSSGTGTRTVYNDAFMPVSYTDESGVTTTYTYDEYYRVLTETTANETTTYTYDETGNILSWVTKNSDSNAYFTYNSAGQCMREQQGEDYTYYTYDNSGNILICATLKKDYNGEIPSTYDASLDCFNITEYTYNSKGSVIKKVDSLGNAIEYEYDKYGNAVKETATKVKDNEVTITVTNYVYDEAGNILSVKHNAKTSTYLYDDAGRVLLANENGKCTRKLYDEYGRIIQEIAPEDYDSNLDGLPNENSYANSNVGHRYFYNDKNQVIKEINRLNVVTEYEYYPTGEKASESFDIYKYYYNIKGLLTEAYVGGKKTVTYDYDDNNKLVSESYANGGSIEYKYNENGQLIKQYYDGSTSTNCSFGYNSDGNLSEMYDYDTCTEYSMGKEGSLITKNSEAEYIALVERTDENSEYPISVTTYDFGENYKTDYTEQEIEYSYGVGYVQTARYYHDTDSNGFTYYSYIDTPNVNGILETMYEYNGDILANKYIRGFSDIGPNQERDIEMLASFDNYNRVTAYGLYDYTHFYSYDDVGQLSRADNSEANYSSAYSYDERGNILSRKMYDYTRDSLDGKNAYETQTFSYDNAAWKDRLTAVDGIPLTYDEVGNVTSFGNTQFNWSRGRILDSITQGNNTYSYIYDHNGIRTSKTVNGYTTYFHTSNGRVISQSSSYGNCYFQYDEKGLPLGFTFNEEQYFYITNQFGDVIGITDADGNALAYYSYDEWGKLLEIKDVSIYGEGYDIAEINPLRYRGYYYDFETGYYYLQSRYYDPSICRFINADVLSYMSVDEPTSLNIFSYCSNDPINYIDPRGFIKYPGLSNVGDAIVELIPIVFVLDELSTSMTDMFGFDFTNDFFGFLGNVFILIPVTAKLFVNMILNTPTFIFEMLEKELTDSFKVGELIINGLIRYFEQIIKDSEASLLGDFILSSFGPVVLKEVLILVDVFRDEKLTINEKINLFFIDTYISILTYFGNKLINTVPISSGARIVIKIVLDTIPFIVNSIYKYSKSKGDVWIWNINCF